MSEEKKQRAIENARNWIQYQITKYENMIPISEFEKDAIGERLQLFYPLMPLAQDPEYCDKNWDEKEEILRINGWPFNADDTI